MIYGDDPGRDLVSLRVALVGSVVQTDDLWEPYRLIDQTGVTVEAVSSFLRDLQAAGRSAATQRSYAMDLLRWFRFLWAVEVPWRRPPGWRLGQALDLRGCCQPLPQRPDPIARVVEHGPCRSTLAGQRLEHPQHRVELEQRIGSGVTHAAPHGPATTPHRGRHRSRPGLMGSDTAGRS
jgi:hypothetical protein